MIGTAGDQNAGRRIVLGIILAAMPFVALPLMASTGIASTTVGNDVRFAIPVLTAVFGLQFLGLFLILRERHG